MKGNMIKQLLSVVALAMAATFAQAEAKIAVVDMQRAVLASDAVQKAIELFKKEKQSDIDTLANLEKELAEMQDHLKKNADVVSDDELRKLKNQFEEKATKYKFHLQSFKKAEQQELAELAQVMEPRMQKALKAIIDEKEIDLVLRPEMVIYSSPAVDITKALLERINAEK